MISFGSVILTTGSGAWLKTVPAPNPLDLPPFTMRVQYALGTTRWPRSRRAPQSPA